MDHRASVYSAFVSYYGNLSFRKIKSSIQGNQHISVYRVKIPCMLCVGNNRYCVAITTFDNSPLGTIKPLSQIKWISFQTRTLEGDILPNEYVQDYEKTNGLLLLKESNIKIVSRSKIKNVYLAESLPLQIELLHTVKGEDTFISDASHEYADEGTVATALETFNSVSYFV